MTDVDMSGQARRLRKVTEILTWDAPDQLRYLRELLGSDELVDELALQFDDSFQVLPELRLNDLVSKEAEVALKALATQLAELDGADSWSAGSLREAPEWQRVRVLAREALALL
jgi:hypothetical protein